MTLPRVSRRNFAQAAVTGAALVGSKELVAEPKTLAASGSFSYCLNTATIRGQKLPLDQEVEIAAKAGYDGIEPWMNKIHEYAKAGGSLKDLGKRIADLGLTVDSAIGFARWIVDNPVQRAEGLENARRDMNALKSIGGKRIAAPPTGATNQPGLNLLEAAVRYRTLLELGRNEGVIAQLEVWGFAKNLSRLGEAAFVAVEANHSDACILPDVYHLFKGGSEFGGLKMLNGAAVHVFHMNDYPATPAREEMNDSHRVHTGDGVAPLTMILKQLAAIGFAGALSLELFNREYYKLDPLTVAKIGLDKMKASVAKAQM